MCYRFYHWTYKVSSQKMKKKNGSNKGRDLLNNVYTGSWNAGFALRLFWNSPENSLWRHSGPCQWLSGSQSRRYSQQWAGCRGVALVTELGKGCSCYLNIKAKRHSRGNIILQNKDDNIILQVWSCLISVNLLVCHVTNLIFPIFYVV